jgi:integrase
MAACPPDLKLIVKIAFFTAMRQGEILSLTWGQVDLKEDIITLRPEDTNTNEGREITLNEELMEMFKAIPRGLPQTSVFVYQGRSEREVKHYICYRM